MASQGVLRRFVPGEIIFRQGEAGHVMYFILHGRVKIVQTVRDVEKILAILGSGSFFGELALFTNRSRSATAQALEDCELVELDAEQLDQFMTERPEVARTMIRTLAERLRETDDLLENMRLDDADSRVTNALLQAAEEQGGGFQSVDIAMDPDVLVSKTALSTEDVKRILARLKRHNLIQIVDKRIHIPSVDLLRAFHSYLGMRLGHHEAALRSGG